MSLVRARTALGLSARFSASRLPSTTPLSLVAFRLLSTTPRLQHAEPAHHHDHLSSGPIKSPSLKSGVSSAKYENSLDVNPYKGGPGALDKAAHLFFFTEIVRGSSAFYHLTTYA